MISVPFELDSPQIISVFGNRINNLVWTWETGHFIATNSLKHGHGYWIYHSDKEGDGSESVDVVLNGKAPPDRSRELKRGWNIIGGISEFPIYQIEGRKRPLWTWNSRVQRYSVIPSDELLTLGRGYFLFQTFESKLHFEPPVLQ